MKPVRVQRLRRLWNRNFRVSNVETNASKFECQQIQPIISLRQIYNCDPIEIGKQGAHYHNLHLGTSFWVMSTYSAGFNPQSRKVGRNCLGGGGEAWNITPHL